MLTNDLLEILVCPESRQRVALLEKSRLDALNARIRSGEVVNRSGLRVDEPVDGALIREDGKYVYPVRANIPIMLIDEAIPL